MSLNTYLDNTASNLIIKGDEKDAIAKSLDVFKSRMQRNLIGHLQCFLF